jgi:hypothetical protein
MPAVSPKSYVPAYVPVSVVAKPEGNAPVFTHEFVAGL